MKRLIVPRSQRMTKSTVSPVLVVVVVMSEGRGAAAPYAFHAPSEAR